MPTLLTQMLIFLVESRHCRGLAKILTKNLDRWNEFRNALGISLEEVNQFCERRRTSSTGEETTFCNLIYIWISKNPKNATFGTLIDILARQLDFIEAASELFYIP